jgi:hypothetical protein
MKKIVSGYYIGEHKNIPFLILRAEEKGWYWLIDGHKVHDWYPSKRTATLAAREYINENY